MTTKNDARAIKRATHSILKGAGAQLAGKDRGPDRQVRRDSYDRDDARARVFNKIEDGSRAAGLGWIDDMVELAERYDLTHRKPGKRGPLMASGVRVLKVLLTRFLRFGTGQLDPAVDTIARAAGYSYKAAHAALRRLKAHGFLDWVRRSRRTGREAGVGPRREQDTNAYFATIGALPKRVLMQWRQLRERRRRRLAGRPTRRVALAAVPAVPQPPSTLALALASLGASIVNRESQ